MLLTGATLIGLMLILYTIATRHFDLGVAIVAVVLGIVFLGVILDRMILSRLARLNAAVATMLDRFPTPIHRYDTTGACDYCNAEWLSFSGRTMDEEVGSGWLAAVHPADVERLLQVRQPAIAAQSAFQLEYRLRRHDGQYRWFIEAGRPFHDVDGSFAGHLGFCHDITDRKRLEEQFRQAQKMEAIGRLASGVAHDFNNLLTAISGYASFVRDTLPPASPAQEDIAQVLNAAERGRNLTRQLLTFARPQAAPPVAVDLNEVILNLSRILRRLISEDIELATIPGPDLGAVWVDPGQVEQILVNLVVNASDAMPQGGRLIIETSRATLDTEYASRHVGVIPGDYVMLAISDTGCGMSDEVKAHIFEPFFTTKGPGKGTGLGLATCYGIARQNGGHIGFYSEPGKGTTFKIYFPRSQGGAAAPSQPAEEPCRTYEQRTVLLVEDDPSVRTFAARVLHDLGYTVLEAAGGEEALSVAASHANEPIHLLVTDVVVPQISGEELARQLKATHPEMKTLFVSGHTVHVALHNGALDESAAFLQKPFTLTALAHKVSEILA
jgi:PAS domain S-box-containing protein